MALTLEQAHYSAQVVQQKDAMVERAEAFVKDMERKRINLQNFITENQAMHDSVFGDVGDGAGDAELDTLSSAMDTILDSICVHTNKTRDQLTQEAATHPHP